MTTEKLNRRILIVDDNEDIHSDFRKILLTGKKPARTELEDLESQLFNKGAQETTSQPRPSLLNYILDYASQGTEAIDKVARAAKEGDSYALIFMDARMPPGPDGIQTIKKIWANHPFTEVILCSAYSDYTEEEIIDNLGFSHRFLILKKPFDPVEVRQMALALTTKWNFEYKIRKNIQQLEKALRVQGGEVPQILLELANGILQKD